MIFAFQIAYCDRFRVVFTDKGDATLSSADARDKRLTPLFSKAAIERRKREQPNNPIFSVLDEPINEEYLTIVATTNETTLLSKSNWLNSILIECSSETARRVARLDFVESVTDVQTLAVVTPLSVVTEDINCSPAEYNLSGVWLSRINIQPLHDAGILGNNVHIGVIDNGFNTDSMSALHHLTVSGKHDLIFRDTIVKNQEADDESQDNHGSTVLSVLAGWQHNELIGSAPFGTYELVKTEDIRSEQRAEEDYAVEALELLERNGVAVVNISLGYRIFDSTNVNTPFEMLDGKTTYPARAVNIASSLGVCVVVAAGNNGPEAGTISTPADATEAITVGASGSNGEAFPADLSSRGPNAAGKLKPELSAQGVKIRVQTRSGSFAEQAGTSLAAPQIAGAIALLKELYPHATRATILDALYSTCNQSDSPNNEAGRGYPDIEKAAKTLGPGYSRINIVTNNNSSFAVQRIFENTPRSHSLQVYSLSNTLLTTVTSRSQTGWFAFELPNNIPDTVILVSGNQQQQCIKGNELVHCGVRLPANPTSATEVSVNTTPNVWPNPVTGGTITIDNVLPQKIYLTEISTGKVCTIQYTNQSSNSVQCNVESLHRGAYIVTVVEATRSYSLPCIIE